MILNRFFYIYFEADITMELSNPNFLYFLNRFLKKSLVVAMALDKTIGNVVISKVRNLKSQPLRGHAVTAKRTSRAKSVWVYSV